MVGSNSTLIRINKDEKGLLDEILKDNPNFRSYAEVLNFLLEEKSTSKAEKLVKTFLRETKKCANFASQVRLGKYRTDILGGKLNVGNKDQTELGYLIESELYLIEIKKSEEEVIKGIGQLLLYRYLLQKTSWIDQLYVYLAVEETTLTKELKELLHFHGIGLLCIEKAQILLEIEPKEQTTLLPAILKQKSKLECDHCASEYLLRGMQCQRCEGLLNLHIYEDLFRKASVSITNQLKTVLSSDPVLKRIFTNQDEIINEIISEINQKRSILIQP